MVFSISSLTSMINQMPGAIVWKDKDCTFLRSNDEYAKVFGFASPDALIGKTDFDLHCKAVNNAERFRILDSEVLLTGKTSKALEIHHYFNGAAIHLVTRKNLYNDNGIHMGIICHGLELSQGVLMEAAFALLKLDAKIPCGSYTITSHGIENLSARESECLFYLLRGKTAKGIACILNISRRTVETHIEHLKFKFGCHTKSDLLALAIEKGFLYSIPEKLINNGLHKVLPD